MIDAALFIVAAAVAGLVGVGFAIAAAYDNRATLERLAERVSVLEARLRALSSDT